MVIVKAIVNCILLHHTFISLQQLNNRKFLKDGLSKSNQNNTKQWQTVLTKRRSKTLSRFVLNKNTFLFLDFFRQTQFLLDYFQLLHQSIKLYAQFLNKESSNKKLNPYNKFCFVDTNNTFYQTYKPFDFERWRAEWVLSQNG